MRRAIAGLACLAMASQGCASIFNGVHADVLAKTNLPNATVTVYDARSGDQLSSGPAPHMVTLDRSAGYFTRGSYLVVATAEDGREVEEALTGGVGGWYWLNFLAFGVFGVIPMFAIDPVTGGMYTYPDEVVLLAAEPVPVAAEDSPKVEVLEERVRALELEKRVRELEDELESEREQKALGNGEPRGG